MSSTPTRRHFLLGGVAATAVGLSASPRARGVRVDQHEVFTQAATAYGVPVALLAAVGHAQTRWQDHDGRPSASMGYGPMHLIDGKAAAAARARADKPGTDTLDTLGEAARLTGVPVEKLRSDPAANIRGAAAVLAAAQKREGGPVGLATDPAQWYAAVARTSGLTKAASQRDFADDTMTTVRRGASVRLSDGSRLTTAAAKVGPSLRGRTELDAQATTAAKAMGAGRYVDAPAGLDVEWIPAPYEQFGTDGDYGNHDLARRPVSPAITHVVVHDVEGSYQAAVNMVKDPTYVSWQYTARSSDGHIAQHLAPKDVGWHAGNWYLNAHSIGIEHEGYAAQGSPWYSEAMYRTTAKLVRHLCDKYRIPIDRGHIIGHDQVPGTTTATIPGMHWDPGPFWDWERYFELMGAPLDRGTSSRRLTKGRVIRILPGFIGNRQPLTGCEGTGGACAERDVNFVTVRTAPSPTAPLLTDKGIHPKAGAQATTTVSDISARAAAGTEYVVAEVRGDWTAIWFAGQKGWILNPPTAPVARAVASFRQKVRAKPGVTAKTYGRCYPESSAYPAGVTPQPVSPLVYTFTGEQEYVINDAKPKTDYYKAQGYTLDDPKDHITVQGRDRYYQVNLGHRISFVRAADVVKLH